jgi:hypothetical protein
MRPSRTGVVCNGAANAAPEVDPLATAGIVIAFASSGCVAPEIRPPPAGAIRVAAPNAANPTAPAIHTPRLFNLCTSPAFCAKLIS